ncbi:MAG: type II toxin-antitoxin system RelB/DinJ family antitoxin [Oscillospiraceae bacterium]|nr:type II toxin-antitoxin system RelB/DinJ family antitoxin [Oscillospiraceae bacterium]
MSRATNNPKAVNINVRLLPDIKREAELIFSRHGLTLPEAVMLFIHEACHFGGIPFDFKSSYTDIEAMDALNEAKRLMNDPNAKTFKSMEELISDLEDEEDD